MSQAVRYEATHEHEIQVRPVAGYIGAEIGGVDLSRPLGDAAIAAIRGALLRHKVIFFRAQEKVGHKEQIDFAKRFGEVTCAHPHEDEPFAEYPEILPIDTQLYEKRYGRRLASYESRWHTDATAAVNPPAASILRAVRCRRSAATPCGRTSWQPTRTCRRPCARSLISCAPSIASACT
jgi:alpha-ketoglutarate-dependent taurine dioxygenase